MKVCKKPIIVGYRFATEVEVIQALEGPVTAQIGDAVMTGVKGENYPIPRPNFDAWYTITEPGKAFKKPMIVEAERMDVDFSVNVSWAAEPITGGPGDYRLTYGPNDFGVVRADIFQETYDIIEP